MNTNDSLLEKKRISNQMKEKNFKNIKNIDGFIRNKMKKGITQSLSFYGWNSLSKKIETVVEKERGNFKSLKVIDCFYAKFNALKSAIVTAITIVQIDGFFEIE